jgi:enamine deaminase RidA (YjgF/YER057c/UK114 family)
MLAARAGTNTVLNKFSYGSPGTAADDRTIPARKHEVASPEQLREKIMELITHKKFKGGRLMPWGKGTVVSGARGYVYLSGNTATSEDYDPTGGKGGGFAGDAAAQWRAILANIKSDLEELGSSLDHLIKLIFFVKGPFPDGGVLSSPNFRLDVLDEFFAEHCPKHTSYNNPPPSEVIGVAALAQADILIEIVAVAALPD